MRYLLSLAIGIMLVLAGCTLTPAPPKNDSCVCTTEYAPVCGMDGKTYSNACAAQCAKVSVAYLGECKKCVDSDGGKNVYNSGVASSAGGSIEDSCMSATDINEAYCDGDVARTERLGCPTNYECKEGACAAKTVPPPPPPAGTCEDNDGGQEFYVAGSTKKGNAVNADICTGLQTVKEYYCQSNQMENIIHQCDPGERCESGRCIIPDRTCSETDGGNDIYNKGTLTSGSIVSSTTRTDSCFDADTVREYYCVGSDFASDLRNCPLGFECQNGECREEDCSDTDGTSIYSRGTVTKGSSSNTDYCTSAVAGVEYRCSGDDPASDPFTCPAGYTCSDGKCAGGPVCTETDSGADAYTYGTTTDSSGSSSDFCANVNTVGEYYCSGTTRQSTSIACAAGYVCTAGECTATCTDSDGGQNIYAVGTTTDPTGSDTDYCSSASSVGEYYCAGSVKQSTSLDCGIGYECSGGKCVPLPDPCTDTDGGDVPETQGTASSTSTSKTDDCLDSTTLREYYCDGDGPPTSRLYTCTMSSCSSGACLP